MKADNIKSIINNIENLPYKSILFDGAWGIGKSYAIQEALEDNNNFCMISMFGISEVNQIYHEILSRLVLKNDLGEKLKAVAKNLLGGLSVLSSKVSMAKKLLDGIMINEKDLFSMLSKKFDSTYLIVIDDLERMSDNILLEEIFGVIDELKRSNYVKVIIIANVNELDQSKKELYDKYSEKVIDRVYHVTELPEKIRWSKLGIHNGFAEDFLLKHNVKNLRTMIKAQNLYDDIKLNCSEGFDELFLDEIRLVCFAIVVEDIENLYYKQEIKNAEQSMERFMRLDYNQLENRLSNYIVSSKCSRTLVESILQYYKNDKLIDKDQLHVEHKIFHEMGNESVFYKTDVEVRKMLPILRSDMNAALNIGQLNKYADEYVRWSEIIGEENKDVLEEYKKILNKMLKDIVLEGKEETLSYSYDLFNISSQAIKEIYKKETITAREFLINTYIDHLEKTTRGKKAFQYSYKLRKYYAIEDYKDIIEVLIMQLLNKKSFPVGMIDDLQYQTCYNIMYLLYHINPKAFEEYCIKLKTECDRISCYRIDLRIEDIKKGIN